VFDLSITKLFVLAVLGLVIFGPEQLPRIAAQAGRALRDLRRLADRAKADLSDSLGPEFGDFDLNDLNPKAFVRKHLLDDLHDDLHQWDTGGPDMLPGAAPFAEPPDLVLIPGEVPPYDTEAT
jgi:sec-independent protein translocase protein TatB